MTTFCCIIFFTVQLKKALRSYYSRTSPLDDVVTLEYDLKVHCLARRFFHHLLRYVLLRRDRISAILNQERLRPSSMSLGTRNLKRLFYWQSILVLKIFLWWVTMSRDCLDRVGALKILLSLLYVQSAKPIYLHTANFIIYLVLFHKPWIHKKAKNPSQNVINNYHNGPHFKSNLKTTIHVDKWNGDNSVFLSNDT